MGEIIVLIMRLLWGEDDWQAFLDKFRLPAKTVYTYAGCLPDCVCIIGPDHWVTPPYGKPLFEFNTDLDVGEPETCVQVIGFSVDATKHLELGPVGGESAVFSLR